MPTYRQEWSYYEDGFGDTNMVFVVSDTYDGLFATTGVIPTQVFRVGSIKQDLDLSSGEIAADELQLSIDEASIDSPTDEAAVAFFLQAENTTVKRFVALFLNTATLPLPPSAQHALFVGMVSNKLKARDIFHNGVQYSSQIEALREWDATCYTFLDQAITDIALEDLIKGNTETNVVGIDATWVAANVADRQAYHKTQPSGFPGDRSVRWDKLVNLNKLLRKLADNVSATIAARGLGSISIEIATTELDPRFRPARFTPYEYMGYQASVYTQFQSRLLPVPGVTLLLGPQNATGPFVIREGDAKILSLGDDATDADSPWIHWRMAQPEGKSEEAMSFLRCKSFTELLYAIAASFGMFVRFFTTGQNSIEIRFIARSSVELGACYFRDAQTGSIDLSTGEAEKSQEVVAVSTLYTPDGSEMRPQMWPANVKKYDTVYREDIGPSKGHSWVMSSEAKKALLSTGVALRTYPTRIYDVDNQITLPLSPCVAHNAVWYWGAQREVDLSFTVANQDQVWKAPIGITNMIFVRTGVSIEPVAPSNTVIWAPVAALSTRIDGEDQTFYSMSMYVNAVAKRDQEYYTSTYELEIPYINGFTLMEFGGSQSWKNVDLGSLITIQEGGQPIEFVVIGIERDMANISTRIKMHRKSRFTFTAPAALPAIVPDFEPNTDNTVQTSAATIDTRYGIADETIFTGDAVRAYYTGTEWRLRRMRSQSNDYNSIVGVALNGADVDGGVLVQTTGRIELPTYSFIPGEPVYVRTAAAPAINISQSLLTAVSGGEDMIVDIGTADSTNSFVLNLFEQFILEV